MLGCNCKSACNLLLLATSSCYSWALKLLDKLCRCRYLLLIPRHKRQQYSKQSTRC